MYLLMTSSLALGLMSCHKKLQTSPEGVPVKALVFEESTTQKDSSTKTVESPDIARPTAEPHPDTNTQNAPVIQPPKKATTTPPRPLATKQVEQKKPVEKPITKPGAVKNQEIKKEEPKSASHFIIAAYNTMLKEGKKIGAACNFYLERVLQVMGFKTVDFLANDFDLAAKKMFKSYKVFKFTTSAELKRHLWSYRERTGFILQWERTGAPGHVAIVERVGETLYIYQASLNKYTARLEKTTLERLLKVNNNKGVRVYSDLQK